MNRRTLIILLAGLNLFLLAGVIFTISSPPKAFGAPLPGSGDYIIVTAESDNKNEVIYLVDSKARRLFAFRTVFGNTPNSPTRFGLVGQRDLSTDFRRPE